MLITARKQKARNSRIPKKNLEFLAKLEFLKKKYSAPQRKSRILELKTRIPKPKILEFL